MSRKPKPIPAFSNEAQERRFWETRDSSDYMDWSKARRARFPNLKPSTTSISLRLPVTLLESAAKIVGRTLRLELVMTPHAAGIQR
jgi:hypothetical protein